MTAIRNITSGNRPDHTSLRGRRVLVVGLGRFGGGVGVSRWLAAQGAHVVVTDQADAQALAPSVHALEGLGVEFKLGGHDLRDLQNVDLVIVNPAVEKARSDFFGAIVKAGVRWTTEMNLFCERCPAPVIGVTGSFGKSTTSAMIASVLSAGVQEGADRFTGVHLGGNIGRSLLVDVEAIRTTDIVVLEMSNAQLEDLPAIGWVPAVAVITNIHPHHLDRYGSFQGYVAAKLNILTPSRRDALVGERSAAGSSSKPPPADKPCQVIVAGDLHSDAETAFVRKVSDAAHEVSRVRDYATSEFELRVPGAHNQANARTAFAVAQRLGIPEPVTRSALAAFRGLSHRLEFVASVDGVDYFNDSKSTSPAATIVAIEAIAGRSLVAIVGGKRKPGTAYDACGRSLAERCRAVVCTGECGAEFAKAIAAASADGGCVVYCAGSVELAVQRARTVACAGDAVLLSPGAPSFDAYLNFTERGAHFAQLVTGFRTSRQTL